MEALTLRSYAADESTPPGLSRPAPDGGLEHIELAAWNDLYRAAPEYLAEAFDIGWLDTDGAGVAVAASIDVLAFNRVMRLGLDVPATEATLDWILATYAAAGAPRFWIQVSPAATPARLYAWLLERGFHHAGSWMKLYRPAVAPPPVETELAVVPIGLEAADIFGEIFAASQALPTPVPGWTARLVGRPGWRHYLAFDGPIPIAAAALFVRGRDAWLGCACTLPGFRGRGAHRALLARRMRDAARLGAARLVMETPEDTPAHPSPAFRNALHAGFQVAYTRPNYVHRAG